MMSLDSKIVILGAQGVGKTSFVVRYVRNTFQQGNASTIGASFLAKKVVVDDDTIVRLQIWDTAGQERFRSMAPMYYRSANCGIICYDITSRDSFEAMESWIHELQNNPLVDDDIMIHIVGTKLDLVDADPSLRQVNFEDCVNYAVKHLIPRKHKPSGKSRVSQSPHGQQSHYRLPQSPRHYAENDHLHQQFMAGSNDLLGANDQHRRLSVTDKRQRQRLKTKRSKSISASSQVLSAKPNNRRNTFSNQHQQYQQQEQSQQQQTQQQQSHSSSSTPSLAPHGSPSHVKPYYYDLPEHFEDDAYHEDLSGEGEGISRGSGAINGGASGGSGGNGSGSGGSGDFEEDPESDSSVDEEQLDFAMSCCHEISAKDNRGVEEVFQVITRRLVDRWRQRMYESYEMENNDDDYSQRRVDLSQGTSEARNSGCC